MEPANGGFQGALRLKPAPNHPPSGPDISANGANPIPAIQKNNIDGETHADGMNGVTAFNQHSLPGRQRLPSQQSAQAFGQARGDFNPLRQTMTVGCEYRLDLHALLRRFAETPETVKPFLRMRGSFNRGAYVLHDMFKLPSMMQ
jgi:hypothetical protein